MRPLILLLACLLGSDVPIFAQGNQPPSSVQTSADDLEKILRESKWKREELLKARFNPILSNLSQRSSNGYENLYLDAVYGVFFSKGTKADKAFQEWQKKNKTLVEDPRLPLATQLSALNLQGQIHFILGDQKQAVHCFVELLKRMANAPDNIAGFHLMQESLQDSLLPKFFGVELDYLKENNGYLGALNNVETLFTAQVLPWYEKNQPEELGPIWNILIMAAGKVALLTDEQAHQFELSKHADLMVAKAESLEKNGQTAEAYEVLKEILRNFPNYPKFESVTARIVALSGKGKPDGKGVPQS